jgi:hypothetical protein
MNERIKELIEQAGFEEKDGHISIQGVYMFNTHRMEKFAELIVQECAKSANDWYQNHDKIHSDPMSYVLAHFGVEE